MFQGCFVENLYMFSSLNKIITYAEGAEMKKHKNYVLLSYFRANARNSLTRISRKTNIPVSTIFDKLKDYEQQVITKHTSLLDFKKLGFDVKTQILFKIRRDVRDDFQTFLLTHPRVNSIYRVNNGFDFLVEAIFVDMEDLDRFLEAANDRGVEKRHEYFILEDLMREAFLAHKPGFEELVLPMLTRSQ